MKQTIFIFHFLPLELFPPVLNIINHFASSTKIYEIIVVSTYPGKRHQLFKNSRVKIIRLKNIDSSSNIFIKLYRYLKIYCKTFFYLLKFKPKTVFYFETLSSLPILIYKRIYINVSLYIHYHELVTLDELNNGRILNKYLNRIENKFYRNAKWISQTNSQRLLIFAAEQNLVENINTETLKCLPNYPPKSWINLQNYKRIKNYKIKILYIGSLSLENMFLAEFLEVFGDNHNFEIDFYSHTISNEINDKLSMYENVKFKGSLNYEDIPNLKGKYDIGLVLYKGGSLNVEYCAPNKIFEYLALDMDVWCSDKLITARDYSIDNTFPKMILLDYTNLETFDWREAIDRTGMDYKQSPYFCEDVYNNLLEKFDENLNT